MVERHSATLGSPDVRATNAPGSCIEIIRRALMQVHSGTTQMITEWQVKPGLSVLPG